MYSDTGGGGPVVVLLHGVLMGGTLWAEQQRAFTGPVLVVWARDDRLMPPAHAERLAEHFDNAELVWVDDSRTLIPIDQPEALATHLERFLERTTGSPSRDVRCRASPTTDSPPNTPTRASWPSSSGR